MTLEQLFALYLEQQQPTASVRRVLWGGWKRFSNFCRQAAVEDLTSHQVRDFHQHLLWEPGPQGRLYKPNSVDQFLRRVRQVLRWAHQEGFAPHNPSQDLLLPRPSQPVREILRWDELQAVLAAFDQSRPYGLRDAALYAIVTETELGVTTCLELLVGQENHLELEEPTRQLLQTYLERARPLLAKETSALTMFLGSGGRPIGRQAAFVRLQQAARAAGIAGQVVAKTLQRSHRAHFERQARSRHFSFNREPL